MIQRCREYVPQIKNDSSNFLSIKRAPTQDLGRRFSLPEFDTKTSPPPSRFTARKKSYLGPTASLTQLESALSQSAISERLAQQNPN